MSWITKKIIFARPYAIPEVNARGEQILPPGTGAKGFVVIIGPAWTARLVSEYFDGGKVQRFNPPIRACEIIRHGLKDREVIADFCRRCMWAQTEEEFFAWVIERNRMKPDMEVRGCKLEHHPTLIPPEAEMHIVDIDQITTDERHDENGEYAPKWRELWRWNGSRVEPDLNLIEGVPHV